jgi:CIC family chloride channel protein
MGGALAGFNSIPLTSIMLVFEVTGDYKFILPLMFVSVISYLVTVHYNHGTVYSAELLEEGIDVSRKGEADFLGRIEIKSIMRRDFDCVGHRTVFEDIIKKILSSKYGELFVINDSNEIIGMISLGNVKQAIADNSLSGLLIAADLSEPVAAVTEDEPVSHALKKMEMYDMESIPVVKSDSPLQIAGIVTHQDIIASYNSALKQIEAEQELVNYRRG